MHNQVWTFTELDVLIFKEDANGSPIKNDNSVISSFNPDDPDFDPTDGLFACYLQEAALSANQETIRRPVSGRSTRKLTTRIADDCNLSCDLIYFYGVREHDVTKVFNRNQRLRIVLRLFKYSNAAGFENDSLQLLHALATSFRVTGHDNDIVTAAATFEGESILG